MKEFKDTCSNIAKELWLPALLIVAWVAFLTKLNISSSQSQQVVLGIVLGTSLGFIADLFKKSIDDFRKNSRIKSAALKLLAQEALSIYRTMELFSRFLQDKMVPDEFKKGQLPPNLDLHYWKYLSSDKDFILLASQEPFTGYYQEMWNFEKLNQFHEEAEQEISDERLKDKPKPMANIYAAAYHDSIKSRIHEKFALRFYSKEQLAIETKAKK